MDWRPNKHQVQAVTTQYIRNKIFITPDLQNIFPTLVASNVVCPDATTFVRTCDGNTTDFPINIGLHQGSALSPYLFALVMDEVTRDIQSEIP